MQLLVLGRSQNQHITSDFIFFSIFFFLFFSRFLFEFKFIASVNNVSQVH